MNLDTLVFNFLMDRLIKATMIGDTYHASQLRRLLNSPPPVRLMSVINSTLQELEASRRSRLVSITHRRYLLKEAL